MRNAIAGLLTALALALVGSPGTAAAASMHCGTRIVSRGDPAAKLLRFCGQPESVQKHLAHRTFTTRHGRVLPGFIEEVWIEEWTYNFGPLKLMRLVRVENGVVANIRQLGRGF